MPMHCFFFSQPPLVSSLTLPWTIARFLDPFYTFSPAHRRVIRDFTLPPFECIGIQFFNLHTNVTDLEDTMPRQRSHTHTRDLGDTMPRQRSLYTYLGKQRICTSAYILNLRITKRFTLVGSIQSLALL